MLARPGDKLKVMRNVATYAAVSLLGYGAGLYDLNAIEHNRRLPVAPIAQQHAEQLALSDAKQYDPQHPNRELPPCDESAQAGGLPCAPRALTYISDAAIVPSATNGRNFDLFGLESRKGLVDLAVALNWATPEAAGGITDTNARRVGDLAFTGSFDGTHNDHPRLTRIRKAFTNAGRPLNVRFTGMAQFFSNGKPYALIAGYQFGLLLVDLTPPLNTGSLADVIWIPSGAYGVRHIAGTHYATAVDGEGRSLLIDLSRIDERRKVPPLDILECAMPCDAALFPTVEQALAAGPDPASPIRFGSDDPRIVWKSEPNLDRFQGSLAPVGDPATGFLYGGDLLEQTLRVIAGLEPRVSILAGPSVGALKPVEAVVPLGIAPPAGNQPGALGAFRIEVALPGSMTESTPGGTLQFRVEGERVPGILVATPPAGWPAAHTDVTLRRVLPESNPALRYQKGWNSFVSDPVIVAADPRATKAYAPAWNDAPLADKEKAGCFSCDAPAWTKSNPNAKEIYSYGRQFSIRPSPSAFTGSYAFATTSMARTITTIQADTVRPTNVRVAGQNPPVAGGALLETTYLHSGEVETAAVDLVPGGRAGWDVALGRLYRSRTLGFTSLGAGWDSPLFKRLRVLPTGVEYRDGAETWFFARHDKGFFSPPGLFLRLIHDERGWALFDQQWRVTRFDDRGLLVSESDEFTDATKRGSGNTIHYAYDDAERLVAIVDPAGRKTDLAYDAAGFLSTVTDWRGRVVKYRVINGLLREVTLPPAKAAQGVPNDFDHVSAPPRIQYAYAAATTDSFAERLELATNLEAITDPHAVETTDHARVTFTYGNPSQANARDRVIRQGWATGEFATFNYTGTAVETIDALGQLRTCEFTDDPAGNRHFAKITEDAVPLVTVAHDATPAAAPVNEQPREQDLVTTFETYGYNGELQKATYPNGRTVDLTWRPAGGGAAGSVLSSTKITLPVNVGGSFIQTTFDYDTVETTVNTIRSFFKTDDESAQPKPRVWPSPSRARLDVVHEDEGIRSKTTYDQQGRVFTTLVEDTTPVAEGETPPVPIRSDAYYFGDTAAPIERGRPQRTASADVSEEYSYATLSNGGERVETKDTSRGTTATELYDSHGRLTSRTVAEDAGTVLVDERFGYDESGRLVYHSRTQQPIGLVETHIKYDGIGRELERSVTKAIVDGTPTTLVAKNEFDLRQQKITRFDPVPAGQNAAAREITTLDKLGRPINITRLVDDQGPKVVRKFGYDVHGLPSYETDNVRTATLRKHDPHGREILSVASDGTRVATTWSPFDEPLEITALDANGDAVAQSKRILTSQGRVRAVNEALAIGGAARQTRFSWKGGRTTTTRTGRIDSIDAAFLGAGPFRTQQTERDLAGRVSVTKVGETAAAADHITETLKTWAQTTTSYIGSSPNLVETAEPRYGTTYRTTLAYDGLGRPTHVAEAALIGSSSTYDEAGNVIRWKRPGMNEESATFDSRGLTTSTTMADGKMLAFKYDALGNLRERADEATPSEATRYETDVLGRTVKVTYPGGSFEETVYENGTGLVEATRDRGGQWLSYVYDAGGRVTVVKNGRDPATATDLVQYQYDAAGRLILIKNADAGIGYAAFDALGRPGLTRTYRYAGHSGLEETPAVLDVHVQRHTWSIHDGEREAWRMPAAGTDLPPEDDPASPWLQTIRESRDAGANLIEQRKDTGAPLLEAHGRSVGRLGLRKRITTGAPLTTDYGFADETDLPPNVELPPSQDSVNESPTGLPLFHLTTLGDMPIAGTANRRDDAQRLGQLRDLAGDRLSGFGYDARGRLTSSVFLQSTLEGRSPIADTLVDADFRQSRYAPPVLTPDQHVKLGAEAEEIERLSWTATKKPELHQLDSLALTLDGIAKGTRDYEFDDAGRRTTDGRWISEWNELGRLKSMTSVADGRRIEYQWDPNHRLVGRVAKQKGADDQWTLETRTNILARDGLPAETTFVWDPIVDRLVAIYATGASTQDGATAEAGLLRQYLHGDQAYDDPTRVLVAATPGATPTTYFPILDESATGSLTAVAAADGTLIERVLYADAYGDAPRYLHGPVVDRVSTEILKDNAGEIAEVRIRVHLSDAISATTTLPTALRLAATRADHTVAYTSSATPELEDRFTALYKLDPAEWLALTTAPAAQHIEIAVTRDLRAEGWGPTPALPIPSWAPKLYPNVATSPTHPVIVREPIPALTAFAAGVEAGASKTRVGWEVGDLYLVASGESKSGVGVGFKGAPFVDGATGLVLIRNRWYDAGMGSWLTPDAKSYVAGSSNLYAGFNDDPVNNADPDGNEPITGAAVLAYLGNVALQTGVDVAIDWAWHEGVDLWNGTDKEFNWHDSLQTNFAINVVSGAIGGKLKHLAKLQKPIVRKAVTEGAEYVGDVAATGTVGVLLHKQSAAEAYGTAAIGGAVGRGFGYGFRHVRDARFFRGRGDEKTSPWLRDSRLGVAEQIESFREGGSFLIPESSYRAHMVGSTFVGRPGGQFLIPRRMMDELLDEAAGDLHFVKKRLGIPAVAWKGPMRRVDIAEPLLFNTRLATGLEPGANSMFRWGGYTSGGIPEAVLDVVPRSQVRSQRIRFRR